MSIDPRLKRRNKETGEETILRQQTAGKKSGNRFICQYCDFIFFTTTWSCQEWEEHKEETGHLDHYAIKLKKVTE